MLMFLLVGWSRYALRATRPTVGLVADEKKTFLVSVKASAASGPSSRPSPDCFMPPNGVVYRTEECEFTEMVPLSTPRETRMARPRSLVQIDPERP